MIFLCRIHASFEACTKTSAGSHWGIAFFSIFRYGLYIMCVWKEVLDVLIHFVELRAQQAQ